ncbi:MAG: ABC transporter ATP-binding protein [bacterium]|nr:ABC transporter ATP-binding protein [bacterium]
MSFAIQARDVSKDYRRMAAGYKLRTLKSALLERSLTDGLRQDELIPAVRGLSFNVEPGEAFAVIGSNGSGKSTLLKMVAGILKPTAGEIRINGRVAALIELGAGFHPEISGRENVFINGAVLGLSRREIDRRYDEIVEFSGLEKFMDEPVKNYSSGMYVRLGFSVAIHTDPDILLVDEVLAVGDEAFAHRCIRRIEEFLARGRTVLLVTHSLSLVEEFADRCLWLEGGGERLTGDPRRVVNAYRQSVAEAEGRVHQEAKEQREQAVQVGSAGVVETAEDSAKSAVTEEPEEDAEAEVLRWGTREAEIVTARMLNRDGSERYNFDSGDRVVFEIQVKAQQELDDFVFGVGIFTFRGVECWGTNTTLAGFESDALNGWATVRVVCPELRLAPGEYSLDVAVHARDGYAYDYQRRILSFTMTAREQGVGVYFPSHEWQFEGGVKWSRVPTVS